MKTMCTFLYKAYLVCLRQEWCKRSRALQPKKSSGLYPEIKKTLWGGEFWTKGFYMNTVGHHANETVIQNYVRNQGKNYHQLHKERQLTLFD